MSNELFRDQGSLREHLETQKSTLRQSVSLLTASQLADLRTDELVARIVDNYKIDPVAIQPDAADWSHDEVDLHVPNVWRSVDGDGPSTVMVRGNKLIIRLPFSGAGLLFHLTPSTRATRYPHGQVHESSIGSGYLQLQWGMPLEVNVDQFNRWWEEQKCLIGEYVGWANRDVATYHSELGAIAAEAVSQRRAALEKQGKFLKNIAIPFRRVEGAPAVTPIPMPKQVARPLPAPKAVEQQYEIREGDYEFILSILRHESRSFEEMPATFRKLNEEDLRSVVLAHLNGHFHGDAAGERFRNKGKTDICVVFENRAAFVAECKVWHGQKAATDAIDQLLSYVTWRDCRAAMVLFNTTVKSFAELQKAMPSTLAAHPRFVRHEESGHSGEWRFVVKGADDDARRITVHVFLVDIAR